MTEFNASQPLDALPGHPEYQRYPHRPKERFGIREAGAFHKAFAAKIADTTLQDHIIPDPNRSKVSHIEDYRLVAVMPRIAAYLVDSYAPMEDISASINIIKLREAPLTNGGAHFEYKQPDGQPYMDSRIGIGLAYRERIVALCAGGLAMDGAIITQIQDISRQLEPGESPRKRFSNGLFNGFLWRDTLVAAWHDSMQNVTPTLGEQTILVQSARNNPWIAQKSEPNEYGATEIIGTDMQKLQNFQRGYDNVAQRLGGQLQHPLGDFVLPRQLPI